MSTVDAVLKIAKSQVGVHEIGGNNRGPQVEAYLRATGTPPGEPWCASFVAWVLGQAGVDDVPRTADTWALKDWAKLHGCLHDTPRAGDLFLLQKHWGADGIQPYHVGFVSSVAGSYIGTIEGNTSARDRADGDGVEAKSQPIGGHTVYVRWADVTKAKPAATLRVKLENPNGFLNIDCRPDLDSGKLRCDLRAVCEALGFEVDATKRAEGLILIRRTEAK